MGFATILHEGPAYWTPQCVMSVNEAMIGSDLSYRYDDCVPC